jgi:hypothetical protein
MRDHEDDEDEDCPEELPMAPGLCQEQGIVDQ